MNDNEIIKGLFAGGMPVCQIARKMEMSQAEVCGVLGCVRVHAATERAPLEDRLLCIIAAVSNPYVQIMDIPAIAAQMTGRYYRAQMISKWLRSAGMRVHGRAKMAIRYQAKAHVMWVLFMAGRLEMAQ